MSDWFGATILIGGQLPVKELPSFIAALNLDVPFPQTIKEDLGHKEFMEQLKEIEGVDDGLPLIHYNGSLRFYVAQARWGRFENLEEFCVENNLSYIRNSDSYDEYLPEVEWWTPGMEAKETLICDNEQQVTIRTEYIRDMMIEIENFNPKEAPLYISEDTQDNNWFLAQFSLKNGWDKWEALKAFIDQLSPKPPTSPGKFEII